MIGAATTSDALWTGLQAAWPWVLGVLHATIVTVASAHVILRKRNVRASIAWAGLILLSPFFGAAAYYFFGVNRIQRRAARITSGLPAREPPESYEILGAGTLEERFGEPLGLLGTVVANATGLPLVGGNAVDPLVDGDEAYPAMREAIDRAERSIALCSYIFDNDSEGRKFVDSLERAVERGVTVRVLVDSVGARYSRPTIVSALRRAGVRTAEFLPTRIPLPNPYFNLRSHRKLMIVDGREGFVGGMNIRQGCVISTATSGQCRDVHFRLRGPVLGQLFAVMAHDWRFATGEALEGELWSCTDEHLGEVACRAVPDGPDEDIDTLRRTLLGALQSARQSVRIVTPYFLPDDVLTAALDLAAMRGIAVDIVLPQTNNLLVVKWAMAAQLQYVIRPGCRVWLSRGPFDHSKLMVVDDAWTLLGSANWDPRSLRLNFEINLECYDRDLAKRVAAIVDRKREDAIRVTSESLDSRGVLGQLRDGAARLLSPYL